MTKWHLHNLFHNIIESQTESFRFDLTTDMNWKT